MFASSSAVLITAATAVINITSAPATTSTIIRNNNVHGNDDFIVQAHGHYMHECCYSVCAVLESSCTGRDTLALVLSATA